MSALAVHDLTVGYDGRPVVHGIDLVVPDGAFGVLLGANGAGKTTTLRAITGRARVLGGDVTLDRESVSRLTTAQRVARGIVLVPEGRRVFSELTVVENLRTGALGARRWRKRAAGVGEVFELFPALEPRAAQLAGTLSGGEQQMLAIGRALMARPRVLLVDEPSLGLAPIIVARVFDLLARIRDEGTTVLAVEQTVAVLDRADYVYVLERGRIRIGGAASEVSDRVRAEVVASYLGASAPARAAPPRHADDEKEVR